MTHINKQTDREKALDWWNAISFDANIKYRQKYFPDVDSILFLNAPEIETIWRSETQPVSSSKGEEFGELNVAAGSWSAQGPKISDVADGQTYFSFLSNNPERRGDTYMCAGFFYPHSVQTPEEMQAHADLFAASKDLYYALNELYAAIDSCIDLTPEVMQKAKAALLKANPNKKGQ